MLSFVYDVADLYKVEITIPLAFSVVGDNTEKLEGRIRHACRDGFRRARLLERIVDDISRIFTVPVDADDDESYDMNAAIPGPLWDPTGIRVPGGLNQADDPGAT